MRRAVGDEDPPRIPLTYPGELVRLGSAEVALRTGDRGVALDVICFVRDIDSRSADRCAVDLQFQKGRGKYRRGLMIDGGIWCA